MTEAQIIRKALKKFINGLEDQHVGVYSDKRKNGRRKVYKLLAHPGEDTKRDLQRVLRSLRAQGISGWKLWEGLYGGYLPMVGITKFVPNKHHKEIYS